MTIIVRDSTDRKHLCIVDQENIHDARSRALLDGVTTQEGEWINPAHVVGISEPVYA
jgi:hypothetical protein